MDFYLSLILFLSHSTFLALFPFSNSLLLFSFDPFASRSLLSFICLFLSVFLSSQPFIFLLPSLSFLSISPIPPPPTSLLWSPCCIFQSIFSQGLSNKNSLPWLSIPLPFFLNGVLHQSPTQAVWLSGLTPPPIEYSMQQLQMIWIEPSFRDILENALITCLTWDKVSFSWLLK